MGPLSEQARGSNQHKSKYKGDTAKGTGSSQRPLQKQMQVRDLYRSRPKPGISVEKGLSKQTLQEQT